MSVVTKDNALRFRLYFPFFSSCLFVAFTFHRVGCLPTLCSNFLSIAFIFTVLLSGYGHREYVLKVSFARLYHILDISLLRWRSYLLTIVSQKNKINLYKEHL